MPAAIQCRDLRKTYDGKVEAVRGLNLEIQPGECFGLLGPNGAGKTTTIEILEGLLPPTSGQVSIFGHSWRENESEMREWLGISLQETRLSEKLTVRETIELFASFYREPRSSQEVLEQLELNDFICDKDDTGQKKSPEKRWRTGRSRLLPSGRECGTSGTPGAFRFGGALPAFGAVAGRRRASELRRCA